MNNKMKIEWVKIADLKLATYNPRTIADKELDKLKSSLERDGWLQNVVINKDNTVISGHQRIRAWKELGNDSVPCHRVDVNKKREKSMNVKLNGHSGKWDGDKLYDIIFEIKDDDEALKDTMMDNQDISQILDSKIEEDEEEVTIDDALEDAPKMVKLGDIFQLGDHRIMCGDCTDQDQMTALMQKKSADMVWTDPPYNVNYKSIDKKLGNIKNDNMKAEAFEAFCESVFDSLQMHMKAGAVSYICSGWQSFSAFERNMAIAGMHISEVIIWVKNQAGIHTLDYPHIHEQVIKSKKATRKAKKGQAIFYGWKEGGKRQYYGDHLHYDVWEEAKLTNSKYVHPTEKPDWLIMRALQNSSKYGDIVLDVFGRSGSALIACEKTGRKARLMELDERFVEATIYRWEKLTKKKAKKL